LSPAGRLATSRTREEALEAEGIEMKLPDGTFLTHLRDILAWVEQQP
jgi:hypothetical protein